MYLSRTTDGRLGAAISAVTVDLRDNVVRANKSDFENYKNLPGAEGIVFIGDELHILYESGALSNFDDFFNKLTWNQFIKDCTDVIWRIDENDLSQTVQIENTGLGHRIQSILAKFLELIM